MQHRVGVDAAWYVTKQSRWQPASHGCILQLPRSMAGCRPCKQAAACQLHCQWLTSSFSYKVHSGTPLLVQHQQGVTHLQSRQHTVPGICQLQLPSCIADGYQSSSSRGSQHQCSCKRLCLQSNRWHTVPVTHDVFIANSCCCKTCWCLREDAKMRQPKLFKHGATARIIYAELLTRGQNGQHHSTYVLQLKRSAQTCGLVQQSASFELGRQLTCTSSKRGISYGNY